MGRQHHRYAGAAPGAPLPAEWSGYATANVRDAFLASLEQRDEARSVAIARHLVSCRNPLPSATCAELGVAPGSSYGAGAQALLAKVGAKP